MDWVADIRGIRRHGLVSADYAQSIGLPIEDCTSVLYAPRVALAYYVHFMNQYHEAFGVTTVPKTLGGEGPAPTPL